jgi:hypothetical protein
MERKHELIEEFERLYENHFCGDAGVETILSREKNKIVLKIPKKSRFGFDVSATVQTYGIYPKAGEWDGAPWEPMSHWTPDEVCKDFFGFLRMLLSPDAQLCQVYRHDRIYRAEISLRSPNGWEFFEDTKFLVLPYGQIEEEVFINDHLPSRYPYTDLESTSFGVYRW